MIPDTAVTPRKRDTEEQKKNRKTYLRSYKATERESGDLASVDAIGIEVANVKLNGRVVLRCDQSVCRGAAPQGNSVSKT